MQSLLRHRLVTAASGALVLLSTATLMLQVEQTAYAQNLSNPLTLLKISSFRENGPAGPADEFVEIFNPSSTDILISSVSVDPAGGALGIGVFAGRGATSASAKVDLKCRIPGAVTIKARGHYLCVGSSYSLTALGTNIGASHPGDQIIGTSGAVPGEIPDDAGLALLPFGSDIVVACLPSSFGCNGGFAVSGIASFTILDRVGFNPYGPGAPSPGPIPSSVNLSGNYCELNCLQPVGDASNTPAAFSNCAGQSTVDFPTFAGSLGRCFGMSGQYKIERRRTVWSPTNGDISRDTDTNTDDFLLVAPNPGINVGLNITGISGVKPVLGAAVPWGLTNPPNLSNTEAPRILPSTVFQQTGVTFGFTPGPGSCPQIPENLGLGIFTVRMSFKNLSPNAINGGVFRVDNLSTLCGPQSTLTTGNGNGRNLASSPTCAGGFTAILKALNSVSETFTGTTYHGTVLEDLPTAAGLSPLGGGVDNTWGVNPGTSCVGDGVRGGVGSYSAFAASPSGSLGDTLSVQFQFGVIKTGTFILLVQPEGIQ